MSPKYAFLALAITAAAVASAQQAPKDRAVIEDTRTGKQYEVKVPNDIAEVEQTGPHDFNVRINREAAKRVELRELPSKPAAAQPSAKPSTPNPAETVAPSATPAAPSQAAPARSVPSRDRDGSRGGGGRDRADPPGTYGGRDLDTIDRMNRTA